MFSGGTCVRLPGTGASIARLAATLPATMPSLSAWEWHIMSRWIWRAGWTAKEEGTMAPKRGEATKEPEPNTPPPVPASVKGLSRDEAYDLGKRLRKVCPRELPRRRGRPRPSRPDAVQLVLEAEKGRMPELLPLRHGRMARSAFTFYRGAALTMAADLAASPVSRHSRAVLRGRPPVQLRRVRHAGTSRHLLHQRPGRNAAGPVGVGRQAPRGQLRRGVPGQRPERSRSARTPC